MNEESQRWSVVKMRDRVPQPWIAFAPNKSAAPSLAFETFDRAIGYATVQATHDFIDRFCR